MKEFDWNRDPILPNQNVQDPAQNAEALAEERIRAAQASAEEAAPQADAAVEAAAAEAASDLNAYTSAAEAAPEAAEAEAPAAEQIRDAEAAAAEAADSAAPVVDGFYAFRRPETGEARQPAGYGAQTYGYRPAQPGSAQNRQPGYQAGQYYGAQQQDGYQVRQQAEPGWQTQPQPVRPAAGAGASAPVTKSRRSGSGLGKRMVALALVCALLGGLVGAGGFWLASRTFGSPAAAVSAEAAPTGESGKTVTLQQGAPRDTNAVQTVQVDRGQLMTASEVYKASVNSTVGITTEIVTTNYWGQSTAAAAGSGFILTEDGYILTNQHVIDKASSITVAMYDGTTYPAELVGYDVNNDIAVLKIDAKDLTPVTLGDSEKLEVGDEVIAIGNPLGELTFSLTKGNVSALNRAVTLSSKVTMNLIQTDAAINSGNSGGALFNMYGEVVGITNAKYSSSGYTGEASIDNIGFAIPINSVRDIVTSIIEKGYISKPYIGVSVGNVSEESQSYGMPKGCAIRSVEEDSPAAKAGLQANDIVTAVNGTEITSYEEFAQLISDSGIGAELELTVYRKGETLTLKVTVGEKIQQALPDPQENSTDGQSNGQSGENANPWGGSGSDPWGGSGSDPWGGGFPWGWGFGW